MMQELLALARTLLPVAFREDGPPLLFEFDDPPLIRPDGTYADEEPSLKRKRVDGDEDDFARYRRLSAGQKGASRQARTKPLPALGLRGQFLMDLKSQQLLRRKRKCSFAGPLQCFKGHIQAVKICCQDVPSPP